MQNRKDVLKEQRTVDRFDTSARVSITFDSPTIVGPGQNISAQGVFFVAEGSVPVTVRIEGSAEPVPGELVRIETMAEGKVGLAVRFGTSLSLPPA
jgi:hypothetical protein